jgi:hypothetical protein
MPLGPTALVARQPSSETSPSDEVREWFVVHGAAPAFVGPKSPTNTRNVCAPHKYEWRP